MKVLIISHMYPSQFNEVSGIFVHELVKALVNKEIEVRVISPLPKVFFPLNHLKPKWKFYYKVKHKDKFEGIDVYYPRYLAFPRSLFFETSGIRMYNDVRKLVNEIYNEFKFDLIHANVALPDGYVAMKLSKQFKVPFLVTIHGQDLHWTIFRNKKARKFVEEVINNSVKTILVSKKLKEIADKELNLLNRKLSVIPNGVNPTEICISDSVSELELKQEYDGKIIILSIANLIKRKGIDLSIRAISTLKKRLPNLIYLIGGDGPERNNLEKLVYDLDLGGCVKFLGKLSHRSVMEYMSICNVFLLPSWKEAFGVVYVEAMAHGKPVIGCQGEGIDGIIINGYNGMLVKPHDVDSIVEAIDYLISNPEDAELMGKRAQKLVLENYTWEKVAEKTIEIYKEIINYD